MKVVRWRAPGAVLLALVLAGVVGCRRAAAPDELQGGWALEAVDFEDRKAPDKQVQGRRFYFEGGRYYEKVNDGTRRDVWTYRLDPGKAPKEIDLTAIDGDQKGMRLLGVYARDGNRLRLSWYQKDFAAKRPTEITPRPGSRQYVWHFLRLAE